MSDSATTIQSGDKSDGKSDAKSSAALTLWTRWKYFLRAQVAAFAATIADFSTMICTVHFLHLHYTIGVAFGAIMGAITNFTINRHWSFEVGHLPLGDQAWKYFLVTAGSLGLNVLGVYLVTEHLHIQYFYSKAVVALLLGFFYNYPLHRFFVYRESATKIAAKETL
jgi:putative flippase GtrA